MNMNLHNQKEVIQEALGALALGGAAVAGFGLGMGVQKGLSSIKNRYMTCRAIDDPKQRDKCIVKILDSMIDNLKSKAGACNNTPDPAQCKYDILLKVDKLMSKKNRLEKVIYRTDRADVLDSRSS